MDWSDAIEYKNLLLKNEDESQFTSTDDSRIADSSNEVSRPLEQGAGGQTFRPNVLRIFEEFENQSISVFQELSLHQRSKDESARFSMTQEKGTNASINASNLT